MSVMDTLISDRTENDVSTLKTLDEKTTKNWTSEEWDEYILARHKGAYNASDLNRVGQAMEYIAGLFQTYGYHVKISPKTDWAIGDIPTEADLARYLEDLRALRGLLTVFTTTPAVPPDMEGFTWQEANDIEKILVDIDTLLNIMSTTFIPCGEALCGGDNL